MNERNHLHHRRSMNHHLSATSHPKNSYHLMNSCYPKSESLILKNSCCPKNGKLNLVNSSAKTKTMNFPTNSYVKSWTNFLYYKKVRMTNCCHYGCMLTSYDWTFRLKDESLNYCVNFHLLNDHSLILFHERY